MGLDFSVVGYHPQLPSLLERAPFPCNLHAMNWDEALDALQRMTLHRSGYDLSEIGTTWLDGFVRETAVRYFRTEEVDDFGGASAFIPTLWNHTQLPWGRETRTWAVPWLADVRVIFYWRDMLEQAGIDEETAFETPERVEETMERLRDSGVETPGGVWADTPYITLHNASTWIWAAGGDIVSADGKYILLDEPEAMEGLLRYFSLHRYMPPEIGPLGPGVFAGGTFGNRQAAVAMSPGFMLHVIKNSPEPVYDLLGVAIPPGPAFVGGSHLVIWHHSRQVKEALALVRFLTSKQAQLDHCLVMGHTPVRLEALEDPQYLADPRRQVLMDAIKTGRALPTFYKWRDVEEVLDRAFTWLWNSLCADPDQDLEGLVVPYIQATARRLAVTLGVRR